MRDQLNTRLATCCDRPVLRDNAETRGHVAYLMAQHKAYREYPLASMTAWLEVPIALGQIQVFFDANFSSPVGYVTWAWLTPEVEQQWLTDPAMLLHYSEWNEGEHLWIMDFVAPFGHAGAIARLLQRDYFEGQAQARSLRRDDEGNVIKCSTWRRPSLARPPAGLP